jgi:hypothetical protein
MQAAAGLLVAKVRLEARATADKKAIDRRFAFIVTPQNNKNDIPTIMNFGLEKCLYWRIQEKIFLRYKPIKADWQH